MTVTYTKAEEPDLRRLCRVMILIRVICVGAALSVVAFMVAAGFELRGMLPVAGLLMVVFPLSAAWWLILRSGYAFRRLVYSQLIADLVIEGGIVLYTGGAQSHLTLLFLVTIFLAGVFLSMRGAVVTASFAALVLTVASLLEVRYLAGSYDPITEEATTYLFLNMALQIAFFYLIAMLGGYVSRRIHAFGASLRSTTTELNKARMDTHLIIESMNSGLVTVNSNYIVTEFNRSAARILGISPDDARGKPVSDVVGPASPELDQKLIDAIETGREEDRGEVLARTGSGRSIPLGVSVSLLKDCSGDVYGAVLVFQDLTEVKSLSERIRLADRLAALGEMSAAIAHEIRTPLASICGSIEMLRDSLAPNKEDARLVELILKESDRLRNIIDHFLEFARSRPSQFCEVELNPILKEVIYLVKNHPHFRSGTKVEMDAEKVIRVWADPETLKQVFYNLALNAIEALEPAGTLKITLGTYADGASPPCVMIAFEDDGEGIDGEVLVRVFEPFYTSKRSGTGLGLAIASKIIEEHGGKIDITSKKGEGTLARVCLPFSRKAEEDNDKVVCSSQLTGTSQSRVE
jgi:two-component system sensor histidine kinase PilS (NtrC family)